MKPFFGLLQLNHQNSSNNSKLWRKLDQRSSIKSISKRSQKKCLERNTKSNLMLALIRQAGVQIMEIDVMIHMLILNVQLLAKLAQDKSQFAGIR